MISNGEFPSLKDLFDTLVPQYKSRSFKPFVASFVWDNEIADAMRGISERRCDNRLKSYIIPGEIKRAAALQKDSTSVRFGHRKDGHGINGPRGDFCLVAGAYIKGHFTAFYRSIELIGGLHYDTVIFEHVEGRLGKIKTITIMAASAHVLALRGNSNEKLYQQLRSYHDL